MQKLVELAQAEWVPGQLGEPTSDQLTLSRVGEWVKQPFNWEDRGHGHYRDKWIGGVRMN